MTIKKLDLWLRSVWSLWDTHGTRLTSILATVHAGVSAVAAASVGMKPSTAAILLAISAVLANITRARGQNNADILSGKIADPAGGGTP